MDVQVSYDKPYYFPGDWVTATVHLSGKPHGRTRQILVFLESVEETWVRVQESHRDIDGDLHSGTRLYHESVVYNQVFQEVPVTEQINQTVVLRYQLPPFPSQVIDIPDQVRVFHGVTVKQDIRLGSDDIRFFPLNMVPYTPNDLTAVFPNEARDQAGRFWIGNVYLFSNDLVSWMFEVAPDVKYRSLRLELEWSVNARARGRSKSYKQSMVIAKFAEPPNPFPPIQIPQLPVSTLKGHNFSITAVLKLVVDRRLASDFNYLIPVNLFVPPRAMAGGVTPAPEPLAVGTKIDQVQGEVAFCENCGNKLEVGDRFCRSCGYDVQAAK
ncbi:MAG: zinc ribbon domain-containing protein [Methanobacteriota archaeon]|nr:MAG: zinc ribbon domain-containing protein [Euryarchaeota archaeon]